MDRQKTEGETHSETQTEDRFVAFCDILGFSNSVMSDFDGTLAFYDDFGRLMSESPFSNPDVKVAMYSDSIMITSATLGAMLQAVQTLLFFALSSRFMIRGGIARGRYWERRQRNDLLVISDALIRAVALEKAVSFPAVVLADDIEIPDEYWFPQFASENGVVTTPLLHFRDRNIVNPFNAFWLLTAGTRARSLMAESPKHRDKYLWFLALHQAVTDRRTLVPPQVIDRLVREGVIGQVG